MKIPEARVKFSCSLSNGESLTEGRGKLEKTKGELSPFLKLKEYIKANDLRITSFSLFEGATKHFNLPNSKKGKAPKDYNFFRHISGDVLTDNAVIDHYTVGEAIFDGYKVQVWVDENDTNKSWVVIV